MSGIPGKVFILFLLMVVILLYRHYKYCDCNPFKSSGKQHEKTAKRHPFPWLRGSSPEGANRTPTWNFHSKDSLGCEKGSNNHPGLHFLCRPAQQIDARSWESARKTYYNYLSKKELNCKRLKRIGHKDEGGWTACLAGIYHPVKHKCLIYSFGIKGDWSFDDEMDSAYGCLVRSFDPSIGKPDHDRTNRVRFFNLGLGGKNEIRNKLGWKMSTFGSILTMMGDTNNDIDILKFDIEFSEWTTLDAMLQEGSLKNVKQIVTEVHSWRNTLTDYVYFYRLLVGLHNAGFERCFFQSQSTHLSCFNANGNRFCPQANMAFINVKYLRSG